jgi:K+-sensing histidine kinase KdpD
MSKTEKVLVCITIQKNSKRLIDMGAQVAKENNADLHILHVEKGMSIFDNPESIELLQNLFEYGKNLGGEVHFVSDEQVSKRIVAFIHDMGITQLVLGQTMRSRLHKMLRKDIYNCITSETRDVEVLILERNQRKKQNNNDIMKPCNQDT